MVLSCFTTRGLTSKTQVSIYSSCSEDEDCLCSTIQIRSRTKVSDVPSLARCFLWTVRPLLIHSLFEGGGAVDLIYVTIGQAVRLGLYVRRLFCRVGLARAKLGLAQVARRANGLSQVKRVAVVIIIHPDCMQSRVGTHRPGTQSPRNASSKGRNIRDFSFMVTLVGDTSSWHRLFVHF